MEGNMEQEDFARKKCLPLENGVQGSNNCKVQVPTTTHNRQTNMVHPVSSTYRFKKQWTTVFSSTMPRLKSGTGLNNY